MTLQNKNKHQLASLCYVRDSQKTLMICKDKDPSSIHYGKYNGLGGKVEAGEYPLENVIREVQEESGLIVHDPQILGLLVFPGFTPGLDWYVHVYIAKQYEGSLVASSEGSLHWVSDEILFDLPLWEGDKEFLPYVIREETFSGKFYYQDHVLKSFSIVSGLSF